MTDSKKTRKNIRKNKRLSPLTNKNTRKLKKIQHHHLLLRVETKTCPQHNEKHVARAMVSNIIKDIRMKPLDTPKIYYVKLPRYNEGLTAITPIQTSHIAFHFWNRPECSILHHKDSHCLLEFDLYTCGTMTSRHIQRILHHLSQFHPTHINATLLNRNRSLTIEKQRTWDITQGPWTDWVRRFAQ